MVPDLCTILPAWSTPKRELLFSQQSRQKIWTCSLLWLAITCPLSISKPVTVCWDALLWLAGTPGTRGALPAQAWGEGCSHWRGWWIATRLKSQPPLHSVMQRRQRRARGTVPVQAWPPPIHHEYMALRSNHSVVSQSLPLRIQLVWEGSAPTH